MKKITTFALLLILSLVLATVSLPLVGAVDDFWTTMEPMLTAKAVIRVAVVDEKIYAIGGSYDSFGVEEYNPVTNTWTTKTPMSTSRIFFGMAVVENKIYTIGGDSGNWIVGETPTNINEVYDPLTNTWETKVSMPTKRLGLSASVVDGKIYCIGGRRGEPTYADVSVTEVYDPSTDTWTTMEPIPTPVSYHASAALDNRIYIIGGAVGVTLNQIYDLETDTWSNGASLPIGVDSAAAGATTGVMAPKRIYVIGGKQNLDAVNLNQIYDPETDTWVAGTTMPTARFSLGVAVVNDSLYAIGGREGWFGSPISAANEQYIPVGYIPEFPSWIILPLFLTATLFALIIKKRLFHPRS